MVLGAFVFASDDAGCEPTAICWEQHLSPPDWVVLYVQFHGPSRPVSKMGGEKGNRTLDGMVPTA